MDIDFDLDDIDSENHDSDNDDDYDGDGNLGVFDFDEGDVLRHNEARHEDHEGSIGGPSSASLFGGQGPRLDHNVVVEGIENVRNKVDSLQPQSDSSQPQSDAVQATTTPIDTIHGSASTSRLNLQLGPQRRPIT